MSKPKRHVHYYLGLDLGQQNQFTALAVLEKTETADPEDREQTVNTYAVRHLERFPVGTVYAQVFERVLGLFAVPPLKGGELVVDQTGVGQAVIDMLQHMRGRPSFTSVAVTAGLKASHDKGVWLVPKRDLVGVLQILLQTRRLKVADTLPESPTLVKELENFQVKPAPAGADDLLLWREEVHDDLVLAVAVAAWHAERHGPLICRVIPHVFEPRPLPWRW